MWLENASSSIIDNVAFPALGVDSSYGRSPNGSSNWVQFISSTKGVSNGCGGGANQPLVMNELFSRGTLI